MPMIRSIFVVAGGLAAAVASGQAPEFAQQYRQRLGGAIDETRVIVEQFDADASRNGLERNDALQRYMLSPDAFLRDRGVSMGVVLERFHALNEQAYRLASWPEFARPLALVRGYDRQVFEGTWRDFEPAVPVSAHGFVWTGAGFLAGALLVGGFARAARFRPRQAKPTP
jgi:hypothetical protein